MQGKITSDSYPVYLQWDQLSNNKSVWGCIQKFPDWIDNEIYAYKNTRWEATQRVMAAKLTRLTHKIAIQLHLVAESCTTCSFRARRPVRKLLDTPSYVQQMSIMTTEAWKIAKPIWKIFLSQHLSLLCMQTEGLARCPHSRYMRKRSACDNMRGMRLLDTGCSTL
jgi:hypothetical protein